MGTALEAQFGKLNLDDQHAKDAVLVSNLPPNAWIESFAMRPNGDGIGARLDGPELYTFSGKEPDAEFELIHTFPVEVATGVINIHALLAPDEYGLITGFVNMAEVKFENFIVWKLKLHPENAEPPVVTKVAHLDNTGFSLGVLQATERTLLIADSAKACIWRLDMATGRTEVLLEDGMMAPASDEDFFGLNRMRLADGHIWFTNSSVGLLGRFPVEIKDGEVPEGEWDINATDGVDIVAADIPNCDGLALNADQSAAFCVAYLAGLVWKVDIDKETGRGSTSVIMENVVSPTGMEIHYVNGKPTLYIMCCGQIEAGWSRDEDRVSWSDIANINNAVSVEVTVTEEVVESV